MKKELQEYRKKRDFSKTPEPKGKIEKSSKKSRFVIQFHQARQDHYDFRLEWKGVLLSWAVPKGLSLNPKEKRLAIRTENHPLSYLRFEGTIPKGQYGGGSVTIFDIGYWETEEDTDKGLEKGNLKFVLNGRRFRGGFALIRLKEEDQWILVKEKDEFAQSDLKSAEKTGKEIASNERKKKNPFSCPSVELALLDENVPTGKNWIYEIKYDGYRIIAEAEFGKVRLLSRNQRDYTSKFPSVVERAKAISARHSMILDGEMICSDEKGRSSFSELQQAIKKNNTSSANYVVFDLLALDGEDLRKKSLRFRKEKLKAILKNEKKELVYSKEFRQGKLLFEKAQELNLEGIIAKDETSEYTGKRSGNWRKIKCRKSDEFVVGGYQISKKEGRSVRSILLGKFVNGRLTYCGKVGSGIRASADKEFFERFRKIRSRRCPFDSKVPVSADVVFVEPILIVEVEFAEYTSGGILRQGSFKGIREDKSLQDLKENPSEIVLTSPNKIIYPEKNIRKRDIADYYRKVSPYMLPYIRNRPLSVVRCSQGVEKAFFKKHPEKKRNGIRVYKEEGKEYFAVENQEGLLSEVQMGTVEFHIQGCRLDSKAHPDYLVFDLDPDAELPLVKVRQSAKDLKKLLLRFRLTSFIKTSGGKGYHIVVPFSETKDWKTFSKFAEQIVQLMENLHPDLYTSSIGKKSRKNKIFIDWMRNRKGATSVAPYSLRARKSATVSMPIFWNELDRIDPDGIDIFTALKRVSRNPWKNFDSVGKKQRLR